MHGRVRQGLLVASSVALESDEGVELEGRISGANPALRQFVINAVSVVWSDATRFERYGPRQLTPGRQAAVKGRWNAERTQVLASAIHIED